MRGRCEVISTKLLSYLERESIIHRLAGVTKLLCFFLWSTAAMITYDTRILVFLILMSFAVFKVSKVSIREVKFVLAFILFFLVINNIAIFLFAPQQGVSIYGTSHPLMKLFFEHYTITLEQIFYQLNITLKYLAVIPPALLFFTTTDPSEFASSLNKIGVSYRLAYSVSIALRYIPDIQRDYRIISQSQQARGVDMSRDEKLWKRIKNTTSIILPLIFSSLDRIETISNTMDLRGFGKEKKRTWYRNRVFEIRDYLAIIIVTLFFAVTLWLMFVNNGRFYNPFK